MKALGIDIGGSAVKAAPVDTTTGKLLAERFRIETPDLVSPEKMGKLIAQIVTHFKWKGPVGVGFPGVVQGDFIRTSANLHKDFVDCDGVSLFAKASGCPVALLNDADAAGLAEVRFGVGEHFDGTVLLLTLGTGVGSALFYRGQLFPNSEMGHFPIKGKSAERFVSAAAKKRRELGWKEYGRELGDYICALEKILYPDLIVIGGGISAKSEKYFKYVKSKAKLVPAEFLNEAGIVGAAIWGAQTHTFKKKG